MSIIFIEHLKDNKIIGLWHITETLEELKSKISLFAQDEFYFTKKRTLNKKREWLASRILLQEMSNHPWKIAYDPFGKPLDLDQKFNLSISHSHAYSTALIDQTSCVGIDVQKMKIPFQTGHDYFLNAAEMKWIDPSNNELINLIWSAKETIYKFAGIFELNFKEAITILPFDLTQPDPIFCELRTPTEIKTISVAYRLFDEYVLTYTI